MQELEGDTCMEFRSKVAEREVAVVSEEVLLKALR